MKRMRMVKGKRNPRNNWQEISIISLTVRPQCIATSIEYQIRYCLFTHESLFIFRLMINDDKLMIIKPSFWNNCKKSLMSSFHWKIFKVYLFHYCSKGWPPIARLYDYGHAIFDRMQQIITIQCLFKTIDCLIVIVKLLAIRGRPFSQRLSENDWNLFYEILALFLQRIWRSQTKHP